MPLVLPPSTPCSFCDYLAGARPYTILERDDTTAILVTYEQRGRGHVLVIPIQHRLTVLELSTQEQSALMSAIVRATQAITAAFDPEGVAVWQNNGPPHYGPVAPPTYGTQPTFAPPLGERLQARWFSWN